MTRDEAINVLLTESVEIGGNAVSVARFLTALDVVVNALENVPDTDVEKNEPLTLDELLKMDGEPMWTVTIGISGSGRWELCTCETVCACPLHKALRCVTAEGDVTDYDFDTYGKTWLAYRQKPEEGTV